MSKRILYIITKSNFGGAQRYVFELALAMNKQGHKVAVACGGDGELVTRLKTAGITTYEIKGFQRDISFLKEVNSLISLFKTIRHFKPDIVHLNSGKAGLLGSFIARLLRVPLIIFTVHGWPFLEPRSSWWRLMIWKGSYLTCILSHKIIVVSQHDFDNSKMLGLKNKTAVIHTAVERFTLLPREQSRQALFDQNSLDAHQYNIWLVTVAELNPNKNHAVAVDAVAEFNSTHTTKIFYTIIGSGELAASLQEQVDLRGLKEQVCFLDYLEEARQYLLAFDIFILPSKKEGLPYVLLEAGLAGLPCITSNVGGISEIIKNNESGILSDPNNHDTIVNALDYFINHPEERTSYSKNLTAHIEENFNLARMVEKTKDVYRLSQEKKNP